jgi:hypothetical protein
VNGKEEQLIINHNYPPSYVTDDVDDKFPLLLPVIELWGGSVIIENNNKELNNLNNPKNNRINHIIYNAINNK